MPTKTIGFVGLGIMGLPMAKNLLDAGYPVVGHNRSAASVKELVDHGGIDGGTPTGVARRADIVLTCLPNSSVVEDIVFGESGESDPLIDGLEAGVTLIDHSTISPTTAESLADRLDDRGVSTLDAPLSGGEGGATEGTLSIMVGGDEEVLNEQMDVLEVLGSTITHCGPNGTGQTTKACNQIVAAAQTVAVGEALVFANEAGADVEAVVKAISSGAAGCWTLDNRAPSMIRGEFDPGFFAEYLYKDLRIATDAGDAYGAPMPQATVANELYKSMVQNGMGRDDYSGIVQVIEMLAGREGRVTE
ncbi:NAD(P)-dependent oxidoreductase [Halobellus limi]|uniref:NAD(P)-dependent oxidoreductase n=1 Tax=Halobellus limi TaxID=699433 RepID=A0A1H6BQB5_9EURY|nr:NAD(P)-dependent oxidoreductase [Halobellus limi]QCC49397.1 NAD(P)-dependent oxidoreductase [Halobellus limi]SEG62635.1 NAD-binding of NADP-dependent 3-hydroxyisobutyrate dehydrogenase [Halobellus limi]